jgi:hypothetical protein
MLPKKITLPRDEKRNLLLDAWGALVEAGPGEHSGTVCTVGRVILYRKVYPESGTHYICQLNESNAKKPKHQKPTYVLLVVLRQQRGKRGVSPLYSTKRVDVPVLDSSLLWRERSPVVECARNSKVCSRTTIRVFLGGLTMHLCPRQF